MSVIRPVIQYTAEKPPRVLTGEVLQKEGTWGGISMLQQRHICNTSKPDEYLTWPDVEVIYLYYYYGSGLFVKTKMYFDFFSFFLCMNNFR